MTGIEGRSGVVRDEAHRQAKRDAAVLATEARVANRAARRAAVIERMRQDGELDAGSDVEALGIDAMDATGNVIPRPSTRLEDYADGEGERQLAWGRYLAGVQRALDVQTKLRQRIPIEDVRAWCARLCVAINRRLPALQALPDQLPGATDEQRAWLRTRLADWDKTYREEVAREEIE